LIGSDIIISYERCEGMSKEKEHVEKHFTASDIIRDVVIGMSDGLTVRSHWLQVFLGLLILLP
jgi:hypothetical protein